MVGVIEFKLYIFCLINDSHASLSYYINDFVLTCEFGTRHYFVDRSEDGVGMG